MNSTVRYRRALRLGLSRHIDNHQNLTTNATKELNSSRSIHHLDEHISKRDCPVRYLGADLENALTISESVEI